MYCVSCRRLQSHVWNLSTHSWTNKCHRLCLVTLTNLVMYGMSRLPQQSLSRPVLECLNFLKFELDVHPAVFRMVSSPTPIALAFETEAILVLFPVKTEVSISAFFRSSLSHLLKVCLPICLWGFTKPTQSCVVCLILAVLLIYSSSASITQHSGFVNFFTSIVGCGVPGLNVFVTPLIRKV